MERGEGMKKNIKSFKIEKDELAYTIIIEFKDGSRKTVFEYNNLYNAFSLLFSELGLVNKHIYRLKQVDVNKIGKGLKEHLVDMHNNINDIFQDLYIEGEKKVEKYKQKNKK